jgi:valyl-tRNA synthetase
MASEQVKVPMDKAWRPQEVERELFRAWEEAGLFIAHADSLRPKYSIVLPPPNVTGELHLGHAASGTIQDIYCRYQRMRGFEVLWLPGTDHAAIGTQNVIEKQLAEQGTTKEELGRRSRSGTRHTATASSTSTSAWASPWTGAGCASRWTPPMCARCARRSSVSTTTA